MNQRKKTKLPRRANRRGGAVIELAITLVVLVNLTFGMIEFGYFFYVKNMLSNAAREGARAGMVPGAQNSDVTNAVTAALTGTKFLSSSYTTSITDTSNNAVDVSTVSLFSPVEVTVSGTWSTIGAGFRPLNLISSSKTVAGTCVMRKE